MSFVIHFSNLLGSIQLMNALLCNHMLCVWEGGNSPPCIFKRQNVAVCRLYCTLYAAEVHLRISLAQHRCAYRQGVPRQGTAPIFRFLLSVSSVPTPSV